MMVRNTPYSLIYLASVAILFALSWVIPADSVVPIAARFSDHAKVTLDVILEMVKLIAALNTALLGAAGALTAKGKDWGATWGRADGLLIITAFVGVAISYYGMYLGHTSVLSMVHKNAIYIFESQLQWGLRLQYYGTLGAAFAIGMVFARMLERRIG